MKLATLSILALAVAALSAHATGLSQNGNSNAGNVQAPPPANQGPTTNNGIGIGVQSSAAGTGIATAKGGKGGKASAKGGNAAQGQKQGQSQDLSNAGNSSVQVTGDTYQQRRIPVATAFAAGLVASYGTCLGSASGGVQGAAIGLSFGSTTMDQGCHLIRRMNALVVMGMPQAALTLACIEDDAMYTAIRTAGYYCAESDRPAAIAYPVPVATLSPVTYIPRGARNDRN